MCWVEPTIYHTRGEHHDHHLQLFAQALDRWTLISPCLPRGVRIFRASNDVGPLFLGPGSTRILEINTRQAAKWRGTAKFLIIVDFPDFWKINGWNALTLWTPISCCAPGWLSYSYYFAYIPPTTCSQDRCSTALAKIYNVFGRQRNLGLRFI